MAAQTFNRWAHHGTWQRLFDLARERGGAEWGMAFLDDTSIRAHAKATGAAKRMARPVCKRYVRPGLSGLR